MSKRIYGAILFFVIALALFVYAQGGTITLTGTVKFENGSVVSGNDNNSLVYIYWWDTENNTIKTNINIHINSEGVYTINNLRNGKVYLLQAWYLVNSSHTYASNIYNVSIMLFNESYDFEPGFNSTFNITFINESSPEYNITVSLI